MISAMLLTAGLISANFPLCNDTMGQYFPEVAFAKDQYYVFWCDLRYIYEGSYALVGTRVSKDGTILDPQGKILYNGQNGYEQSAAFDGDNFLVALRDSC